MKKRLVWLDLLRIIAMVSIIIMHVAGNTINTFHLTSNPALIYNIIISLLYFAIPLFIMISGMYFLNKDISFTQMLKKYILKIFLIIIIFGSFYSLLELIYLNHTFKLSFIIIIIKNILTGNLWAHMWYLYLILGLYLITPFLRIITKNISIKDYRILLYILFIFTILIPELNTLFNINIAFYIPLTSSYLFTYLYSAYIYKYNTSKRYIIISNILAFIAIFIIILKVKYNLNNILLTYTSLLPFLIANMFFLNLKNKEIKIPEGLTKLINSLGICSLGIYLIHQFFINIIFKLLKIDIILQYPYILLFIYSIVILVISHITIYILKKIPLLKKII